MSLAVLTELANARGPYIAAVSDHCIGVNLPAEIVANAATADDTLAATGF